jgi:hypothetical protein
VKREREDKRNYCDVNRWIRFSGVCVCLSSNACELCVMEEVYRQSIWAEMNTNRGNIIHDRFSGTKSDSDRQCEAG